MKEAQVHYIQQQMPNANTLFIINKRMLMLQLTNDVDVEAMKI